MTQFLVSDFPIRSWDRSSVVSFRKTKEEWGGLSNMAAGYRIVVNQTEWRTSEALYQALRFPDFPEIQEAIRMEKSPMAAKMKSKQHRSDKSRSDWDEVRVDLMYWCLRVKLACNFELFGGLLSRSYPAEIVEESANDRFWGAVVVNDDYLQGRNLLGVLLNKLRGDWVMGQDQPYAVEEPDIVGCLLLGNRINVVHPQEHEPKTLF